MIVANSETLYQRAEKGKLMLEKLYEVSHSICNP
jgi:hypothetical protein